MKFDMPLSELQEYMGTNPKPKDFDDYWEHGLNELNQLGTDYELVPADFQSNTADCFHLYFLVLEGLRFTASWSNPKNKPRRDQVCCGFMATM